MPTYVSGAILANLSSTNLIGFVAVVLVVLIFYNIAYRLAFPDLEYRGRAHALAMFFFAELALWGTVWLVLGK